MFNNKQLGFTLVELIVAIAVLSILAIGTLAILNPFEQYKKASDARVKSDLAQIKKALEVYYADKGSYPANSAGYNIVDASLGTIAWGSSWGTYMNVVPKDPTSTHSYVYFRPNGQTYYLYANLSRGIKDPQICKSDGSKCNNAPTTCGSGTVCNFGVSSPNTSP